MHINCFKGKIEHNFEKENSPRKEINIEKLMKEYEKQLSILYSILL